MTRVLSILLCLILSSGTVASADILTDTRGLVRLLRSRSEQVPHRFSPRRISCWQLVRLAGQSNRVDPRLLLAVIKCESDFDHLSVSSKGAMGLMQLMPQTAKLVGVEDPFDPIQNVYGGSLYLRKMLNRFEGNLYLALLAYNAGPTRVSRGDIPHESHAYARKVLSLYHQLERSL